LLLDKLIIYLSRFYSSAITFSPEWVILTTDTTT